MRRFAALVAADPALAEAAIVTAARADGARALAARIADATGIAVRGATLDALAFELLRAHPLDTGLALDLEAIDPLDAEEIFERAAAPLFSAEWSDWLGADVDPEIAGLRTPARFAAAALRLIRKLRDSGIDDDAFLAVALRGATTFYANPPNLTSPALLSATKDEHRASLAVGTSELDRQRKRELDLAKILARLYRAYVDELVRRGCLTASDALAEATRLLENHPAIARALRRRLRVAFVDDVHDLSAAALRFLRALFGDALDGVAVAGQPDAATQTFAGARPERVLGRAVTTVPLAPRTLHPQILAVMRGRDRRRRPRARSARRRRARAARGRPRGGGARGRRPRRGARARRHAAGAHRGGAPHAAHARRLRGCADGARRAGGARGRSRAVRTRRRARRARAAVDGGRSVSPRVDAARAADADAAPVRRVDRDLVRRAGQPAARALRAAGERHRHRPALGPQTRSAPRQQRAARRARRGLVRRRARAADRVSRAAQALVRMAARERRRDGSARDRRRRRLAAAAQPARRARARGCARR